MKVALQGFVWVLIAACSTPAEAQTKAYVTDTAANVVSVIDTATATVVGTVQVGTAPARVAMTRDGSRAYVTNGQSASISVIDTTSDTVTATIAVGAGPSSLAVTPDGHSLYVMTASGTVEVVDTASETVTAAIAVGATGEIAATPDGARVYVAAGLVHIIDTATNAIVKSFAAETSSLAGVSNTASSIAVSPDGSRAYVGVITFNSQNSGFSAGGSLLIVDTASESIAGQINLFSLPATIALTPDGSRVYVAIQSTFVNTGYGMGFFPGRHVLVIDAKTDRIAAVIDLGADGPNWTQQNTAAGIAVTPDRRAVYIAVHRLGFVALADVNTNGITRLIPVTAFPGDVAMVSDGAATLVPYAIVAADDNATVTTVGGTAAANVLSNDSIGGIAASFAHVTLTQISSTTPDLSLDPATGAINAAAGIAVGSYTLVYRACEIASPSNCDDATATVNVRAPYVIDAADDSGASTPGWTPVTNVLANDTLNGATATTATVTLSTIAATSAAVTLNPNGSVSVAYGTAPGAYTLRYRICEIASPTNCDDADVAVIVNAFPINAVDDAGWAYRSGGIAVANVLANDTFVGAAATFATVRLSQISSAHAGIALNVTTGGVSVANGTPVGTYALTYRICEIVTPSNCDDATVTVTVLPLPLTAANDYARGSSKLANTALASVLANDRLGGAPATTANVRLSLVSLTPPNAMIRLDLPDGSVDILGKTSSGLYSLVYQICETAMPANCARGTVTIDLSGK